MAKNRGKTSGKGVSVILRNEPIKLESGKVVGFIIEDNVRFALISSKKKILKAVLSSPTKPEGVQRTISAHPKGLRIEESQNLNLKEKSQVRYKTTRTNSAEIEILILQSHFDSALGDSRTFFRPKVDWDTQPHSTRGHRFVD